MPSPYGIRPGNKPAITAKEINIPEPVLVYQAEEDVMPIEEETEEKRSIKIVRSN